MSVQEQLLAVAAWLRGRYETASTLELPMLASVIAYLETLAALQDQAGPEAEAPPAAADTPPEPSPPEADAPPAEGAPPRQTGTFAETSWGGVVTTDGGSTVRIPYSVVAASGMKHGDRVELTPRAEGADRYFFTRSGEMVSVPPSGVREVVAAIRRGARGWMADVDGRRVNVRPATPRLPDFTSGDIVSLRYSPEDLEKPAGCAYVVRVHGEDPAADPPVPPVRRRVRRRPAHPAGAHREVGPEAPDAAPVPPGLPLALPRVLVVGGHAQNHLHFRRALDTVATVEWCPGSRLTRSLRARVATAPAIVLVTQHMSHNVSEYVMRALRSTGRPYIYARSPNHTGLARQVVEELLPQLDPGTGEAPG